MQPERKVKQEYKEFKARRVRQAHKAKQVQPAPKVKPERKELKARRVRQAPKAQPELALLEQQALQVLAPQWQPEPPALPVHKARRVQLVPKVKPERKELKVRWA